MVLVKAKDSFTLPCTPIRVTLLSLYYYVLQRLAQEPLALHLWPARKPLFASCCSQHCFEQQNVSQFCRNSHSMNEPACRETQRPTGMQILCSRVCIRHLAPEVGLNTTHCLDIWVQILGIVSNRTHQWRSEQVKQNTSGSPLAWWLPWKTTAIRLT